jgi:hypothetical protein
LAVYLPRDLLLPSLSGGTYCSIQIVIEAMSIIRLVAHSINLLFQNHLADFGIQEDRAMVQIQIELVLFFSVNLIDSTSF